MFYLPSSLTRLSALVLQVGVSYVWKMVKFITSYNIDSMLSMLIAKVH